MTTTYEPIPGPPTGSPEWYAERDSHLLASEAAKACGMSDHGTPLGVYCDKLGLTPKFEGNDFTDRGKRFEPFIAGEFMKQTGLHVETGLPMCFHPDTPWIGATPDGWISSTRGVEFKACSWRRAKELGEQHTDQVFDDWLFQTQQQIYVMGWQSCDVFVMVDLHTYRHYEVPRNDDMIGKMVAIETDLWERIQRRDPPALDYKHPLALELVKQRYGLTLGTEAVLPDSLCRKWEQAQKIKRVIKSLEERLDTIKAEVLDVMGEAEIARVPFIGKEIYRLKMAASYWTQSDVDNAQAKLGQVKRKAHTQLRERNAKR